LKFLVDANVLSEVTKTTPDARCIAWLLRHERDLVVDPIILGEIRFGILVLDDGEKRRRLQEWFEAGVQRLHCVAWDAETGLRWAALVAALRRSGHAIPIKDSLIATTALVYDLTIATRNRAHFEPAGVRLVDPFLEEQ